MNYIYSTLSSDCVHDRNISVFKNIIDKHSAFQLEKYMWTREKLRASLSATIKGVASMAMLLSIVSIGLICKQLGS